MKFRSEGQKNKEDDFKIFSEINDSYEYKNARFFSDFSIFLRILISLGGGVGGLKTLRVFWYS